MDTSRPPTRASRTGLRSPGTPAALAVPPGHIGRWVVPATGQVVWWTGRVAIGLRHEPR